MTLLLGLFVTATALCSADEAGALPSPLSHLAGLADDVSALVGAIDQLHDTEPNRRMVQQAYEYALDIHPRNARLLNGYGELLYDELGQTGRATRLWRRATRLDPTCAEPFNNLAIHYCHVGKYRAGLSALQKMLHLEPGNPEFLFNAVQLYLSHGPQMASLLGWEPARLYHEAMVLSQRAAASRPCDFEFLKDYALNFFTAENFGVEPDWGQAAQAWQAARHHAPNDDMRFATWLYEARTWLRASERAKAEACLKKGLALRPQSAVARELLKRTQNGIENN